VRAEPGGAVAPLPLDSDHGAAGKRRDEAKRRSKGAANQGAKGLLDEATELKDDVSAELQKAIEDAMKALQVGDIATGLDKTGLPGR